MNSSLRIAHRGMPRLAPENTLRSFEMALELGAQGIELDVHMSSDGVVVVHHDGKLPGGTELSRTRFADLVAEAPELASLEAVFDLVAGGAELFVEIKGAGIEGVVAEVLSTYEGPAAIHSFDHALIRRLSRSGTPRRLGILIETDADVALAAMARAGAVDLWPHHSLTTAELVSAVHAVGGRVIPWTVNSAADVERVRGLSVDGICTDDVRILG